MSTTINAKLAEAAEARCGFPYLHARHSKSCRPGYHETHEIHETHEKDLLGFMFVSFVLSCFSWRSGPPPGGLPPQRGCRVCAPVSKTGPDGFGSPLCPLLRRHRRRGHRRPGDRVRAVAARHLFRRARTRVPCRRVIFSEEIDGYTIDGGPDALLIRSPKASRLRGDRPRPSADPDQAAAPRVHPAADAVIALPPHRSWHPDAGRTLRAQRPVLVGAASCAWARSDRPRRRDEADESIARSSRDASGPKPGPPRRAAARRHHAGDGDDCRCRRSSQARQGREHHGSVIRAFDRRPNHDSRIGRRVPSLPAV